MKKKPELTVVTREASEDSYPQNLTVESLDVLAHSEPEKFAVLVATGLARLPLPGSETFENHPLKRVFDVFKTSIPDRFLNRGFGEICCEKLGLLPVNLVDPELATLKQFVLEHELWIWRPAREDAIARASLQSYVMDVIGTIKDHVKFGLAEIATRVAHGVPVYRLGESRSEDVRLTDTDQPVAYLLGKAEHQDYSHDVDGWPQWVEGLAFRRADLAMNDTFFIGYDLISPQQIAIRRQAYRRHIGIEGPNPSATLPVSVSSRLVAALKEVQNRYYGANFSIGDQQSWPKQKDVIEWLRNTYGLSEREASSVDIVARPDALRGK